MRSSKFTRDEAGQINPAEVGRGRSDDSSQPGKIFIIGIGPGDPEHMTYRVREALDEVDCIAGYKTYVDLIRPFLSDQEITTTGMRQEVERCQEVVRLAAQGRRVALVSSGDAGIYGMAGILIECLEQADRLELALEVIPGVTAANAAAAVLGAPLMHDFAVISLSDLLTPWEVILRRVHLAAEGDFVLSIYNPKSMSRTEQIKVIQQVVLQYRDPETPVGIVREALRGQASRAVITTLAEFTSEQIDMLTTVIIGNSQTRRIGPYMVTPRGYRL